MNKQTVIDMARVFHLVGWLWFAPVLLSPGVFARIKLMSNPSLPGWMGIWFGKLLLGSITSACSR